ncbi:hypothetical protein B0H14DRAFT_3080626 [Mycena olivaceomarginata]|nr:hypothetical protein B0H14DRAFT_3080626 [Mycena olivaceomarginata]
MDKTSDPHIVSEYERTTYYHGISPDPPELLYRSNLLTNPFPVPKGRHPYLPTKTAHGVFNTPLNLVWHTVVPKIITLLKKRGIRYSAIKQLDGKEMEWYEGTIEKLLAGPALLRVADDTNPTHYLRRLNGDPSARVLGVSNNHVLRQDTTVDYQFKGAGTPRQYVRLAGYRRFQRGLDEIKAVIAETVTDANRLALDIVRLEEKPESQDPEEAEEDQKALKIKREELVKLNEKTINLEKFYNQVSTQWGDLGRRDIGFVDWAPKISIDVNGRKYTKDIATFEVDEVKFKAQFKGNLVDLGTKFTAHELTKMFYPNSNSKTVFKFPSDRLLRLRDCVSANLLASPDCYDDNGEPCLIVMKDGNTTDLTVGRFVGLEAYTCDEFGIESIELAIYNYNKHIFAGDGRLVGILHSGMPKGASNHVTYATPAWWILEQIKVHYPHADFWCTTL